jgi:leucyl aminopeptidase
LIRNNQGADQTDVESSHEHLVFDRPLTCLAIPGSSALPVHAWRPAGLETGLAMLDARQTAFLRATGFTAAAGQITLIPGDDGLAGAVLGLGDDRSPDAHGALAMALPEHTAWRLEPGDFDMDGAVLGFCLGAYQYAALSKPKRGPATLAGAADRTAALSMARAVWLARDLINTPANLLGPAELAAAAQALAARHGAACHLITGAALAAEYPAIAAVGAGSDRPPVVARITWSGSAAGDGAPLLALCGKGVTFDTGGYDLKPSSAMLRMKKDMGGAALMLALAATAMDADLPIRMEVWIGCVENMVSGAAMRPLDVLRTRRGLTVEVGNTDAEGRLVLCDLLAEASDRKPDLLVDAATLTGAARVALGPDLPALFSPDDTLADAAMAAGIDAHDPLWRLPLWPGYESWLASPIADLNNVSSKPNAGAIIAALFLQRFVIPGTPWLHLDTYAWNDQTRPGRPEGGETPGLRTLFNTIRRLKRFY